jgi:8-oxo-dGTP diphosphatase
MGEHQPPAVHPSGGLMFGRLPGLNPLSPVSGTVRGVGEPRVVVGAAILSGARLLAAQRSAPAELAGRWELPGGKVEAGETDQAALLRECREELGVEVMLGTRVGRDWPIGDYGVLRVWLAAVVDGAPRAIEHAQLRWLTIDQLSDVDWLPGDIPVVHRLAAMMADLSPPENP